MAKNLIILNQSKPKDAQLAEELARMLPKCAYYNGDHGWQSSPFNGSEDAFLMALDTAIYAVNNFVKAGLYDNIVFTWYLPERQYIDILLKHLKAGNYFVSFFNLADFSKHDEMYQNDAPRIDDVEYYRVYNNVHPIKLCHLDIGNLEFIEQVNLIYEHIKPTDESEQEAR
ncbi:MAG: hypothetical protein IJM15_03845 [Erysipelotrichaceae bacterium]|nr:hypothetical protein [Erysipelotrichaceae bacterium]